MFFHNLRIYRLPASIPFTRDELETALATTPLAGCGNQDIISIGWLHTRPTDDAVTFVHAIQGHYLITLGVEEKRLPGSVVKKEAAKRAAVIESEQARKVGRKELKDLRDQIVEELLPRVIPTQRATSCWLDLYGGWLVIDTPSDARADEFLEALQRALGGIALRPLQTVVSPTVAMTGWVAENEAPANFSIDQDLELKSAAEGQASIRYKSHALEGDDIRQHIEGGKMATQLGMTWNDRISFVLTDKMQIKRLGFLDILKDEADQNAETASEQFDVDFTIMAGELSKMFTDLIHVLGGELKSDDPASAQNAAQSAEEGAQTLNADRTAA